MIQFTDMTLADSKGSYLTTCELMQEDVGGSDWMLDTKCHISTRFISAMYILHLWKNGKVVIWQTDRPIDMGAPDSDLLELSEWVRESGWKKLCVDDRLIVVPQEFEFWQRMYLRGLVENDELKEHEEEEVRRLREGLESEDDDEF